MTDPQPAWEAADQPGAPMAAQPSTIAQDIDEIDDVGADRLRGAAIVINKIYGVTTDEAYFGASGTGTRRYSTGLIEAEQLDLVLQGFCRPSSFTAAAKVLSDNRLVVISGDEGIGRRVGTFALFRELPDAQIPVVLLSPAYDFAKLAEYPHFKAGRCYLVQDQLGDGRAAAVQRFDVDRLLAGLRKHGSYLAITVAADSVNHSELNGLVVEWTRPDAVEVFDSHLPTTAAELTPEDLQRARTHAATLPLPREVASFVARLHDGVDAALHSASEVGRDQVRAWISRPGDQLQDSDVLMVAALCFVHAVPERTFERALARLEQLFEEAARIQDDAARRPRLQQRRAAWATDSGPVTTIRSRTDGVSGERLVVFRSSHIREHMVRELWDRYGYELLDPLRMLIHELARAPESDDLLIELALGVAILARHNPDETMETFLDDWANGGATERLAATYVLSFLCLDEQLAPRALGIALGWAENRGARRAITAAIAYGGLLGVKYQAEVLGRLWQLSVRGRQIAIVARTSLALLFSSAEDEPSRALSILRSVRQRVRYAVQHEGGLRRRAIVSMALALLTARRLEADELMVSQLLRNAPGSVDVLGEIWVEAIVSAPHRDEAISALRDLFESLPAHPNPRATTTRLATAIFTHCPSQNAEALTGYLERGLPMSDHEAEASRQLVRQFLRSLRAA